MIRFALSALSALVLVLLASCASAPAVPDFNSASGSEAWAKLSTYIKSDMATQNVDGLSISVADSHGEIWSSGFGKADPSRNAVFSPDIKSNIGSVSKLITATAIMRLVEQGKLDLDAPISNYLPELKPKSRFPDARPVTVRDVMTHHSGYPSDYVKGFMPGSQKPANYPEQFLDNAQLLSGLYVATPPGTAFSYSNLSIAMLGIIVERLSGMSFEAFCQQEIFKPLGMNDSSFVMHDGYQNDTRYARGKAGSAVVPVPYIRDLPAGSAISTAHDMAKFAQSYLAAYQGQGGILQQSTVKSMFTVQNKGVAADVGFEIGLTFWVLNLDDIPGEFAVGHGGDLDPFHALFVVMPERNLAVSILVNSVSGFGSFSLSDIAIQALRAANQVQGGTAMAAPRKAASVAPYPQELLASLPGVYNSAIGVLIVKADGNGLKVNAMNQWIDTAYHSDGTITAEARVLGIKIDIPELDAIRFTINEIDGKPALGVVLKGIPYSPATRVEPSPITDVWKARLGDYIAKEPTPGDMIDAGSLFVDSQTGLLMFGAHVLGSTVQIPVKAISDTELLTVGYGRNLGETIDAKDNTLAYGGIVFTKK